MPQREMQRHAHTHHAARALAAAGSQQHKCQTLHEKCKMQTKQGRQKGRHAVAKDCVYDWFMHQVSLMLKKGLLRKVRPTRLPVP